MLVLNLILSFCLFPKFAPLRFSYYGNFGFGLLAFVLGFLLALCQLKEPKKEKSNNGPGEGGENKLVSLENLTNSFKVSSSQFNFHIYSYLKDFKYNWLQAVAVDVKDDDDKSTWMNGINY